MLIQLTPEQVNKYWDALRPMVQDSLPTTVSENRTAMTNILTAALAGDAVFWGYYKRASEQDSLEPGDLRGLVVTAINASPVTKLRRMLVFAFWGDNSLSRNDVTKGLDTLHEYAQGKNCSVIYSFSQNEQLERVLNTMGWESDQTLIYKTL